MGGHEALWGSSQNSRPSLSDPAAMIDLSIDPSISTVAPELVLGCLSAHVVTGPGSDALWREMQDAARSAAADEAEPAARPPIAATRELYRRLGKDPSRYRGSPEALQRRVRAGKELYRIHNVVDVINLVSLRSGLPIGLYDAAALEPPLVFRRGEAGEAYDGIGKEQLNLEGLPLLADAAGPFGSPTSDSRRSMGTETTQEVFAVVFGVTGRAALAAAMEMLSASLTLHAAAQAIALSMVPRD